MGLLIDGVNNILESKTYLLTSNSYESITLGTSSNSSNYQYGLPVTKDSTWYTLSCQHISSKGNTFNYNISSAVGESLTLFSGVDGEAFGAWITFSENNEGLIINSNVGLTLYNVTLKIFSSKPNDIVINGDTTINGNLTLTQLGGE